jgi:hypothetical protein
MVPPLNRSGILFIKKKKGALNKNVKIHARNKKKGVLYRWDKMR